MFANHIVIQSKQMQKSIIDYSVWNDNYYNKMYNTAV